MKIMLTGASGFIGTSLTSSLLKEGNQLVILSRKPKPVRTSSPIRVYEWNPLLGKTDIRDAMDQVEAVIHLAGEPIFGSRWTPEKKKLIRDSRVTGTKLLVREFMAARPATLKVVISASAIGYYGDRKDSILTESTSAGQGFLAEVCQDWESELKQLDLPGVQKVNLRIGIVLGQQGGILKQLLPIFQAGLGGPLGRGSQWMSWIHLNDLIRMFHFILADQTLVGPVNAVSPNPVTNEEFSKSLAKVLHRPHWMRVPEIGLKLALGEMSQLVLGSQRVLPEKISQAGFEFEFQELKSALEQLVRR